MQILGGVNSGAPFTQYIVFTSSGTLTVTNGGTVSICTIGGGAGGGFDLAGGGAGAELDLFANFTITQNLTVTIGASGAVAPNASTKGSNGGTSTVVENVTTLQSALGGGGGGSASSTGGNTGGSGGGEGGTGGGGGPGGASGSNTFAGGTANANGAGYIGGGAGGATAVGANGSATGNGGQGYALSTIDANLTSANFPTTLTGKTYVSSGGGGGAYAVIAAPQGGTNAGNGGQWLPSQVNATSPTSYGCGGGGGQLNIGGTSGFAGAVIIKFTSASGVSASGGQETVNIVL